MQNKKEEQISVLLNISNFSSSDQKFCTLFEPKLIDKCLDDICELESPNVIVAYGNYPKSVGENIMRKWEKRFKRLQFVSVEECNSLNDILRQVENLQLIKTDFLFIYNCALFCSEGLDKRIESFRTLRKQNKNVVASLLYAEMDINNSSLICYRTGTKKLVNYNIIEDNKGKKYLQAKKEIFLSETTFRTDLISLNTWICALDFIGHFAGNYDFKSVENIIQDILTNEEVIGQEIYLNILENRKEIKELLIDKKKAIVEFPGNYSDSSEGEDEEEVDEKNINLDNKQESNVFSQFILEVRESMQELIENERTTKLNDSEFSNLKLEINSCKLAYNIPMDELPRLIFLSFIGITQQQLALFKKTFDQWMVLWNFYFKKPETRIGMLHAIEDFSLENDHFIRIIPNILHFINQEKEFIEDEQIILWYSSLTENSTLRSIPKLKELIEWLGKEEEEEDDD